MSEWTVLLVVPAFGVDTFIVAAGLGVGGRMNGRALLLTTASFEGLMPIAGMVIGGPLGPALAAGARWVAGGLLLALGLREILEGRADADADERPPAALRGGSFGTWGFLAAGLAVSIDEFGAGLALGVSGTHAYLAGPVLAAQAVVFSYLGVRLGVKARRWAGRFGPWVAGGAFLLLALGILIGI